MNPWVALVVWGTAVLALATAVLVGVMRGRYRIEAPAISGHPVFERAYRIQMNTLEQSVIFLPVFLLAAHGSHRLAACVLGGVWLLARIGYVVMYLRSPPLRAPAFLIATLALAGLLLLSAWGIGRGLLAS